MHRSLFLPETVKRDPSRSPLERPGVRSVPRNAERLASPPCAPTVVVHWTNPRPRPSLMVVDRLPCAGAPASTRKPRVRLALQGWHSGPTLALACPTAPRPTTARAARLRVISRASPRLAAHPWACMLPGLATTGAADSSGHLPAMQVSVAGQTRRSSSRGSTLPRADPSSSTSLSRPGSSVRTSTG